MQWCELFVVTFTLIVGLCLIVCGLNFISQIILKMNKRRRSPLFAIYRCNPDQLASTQHMIHENIGTVRKIVQVQTCVFTDQEKPSILITVTYKD